MTVNRQPQLSLLIQEAHRINTRIALTSLLVLVDRVDAIAYDAWTEMGDQPDNPVHVSYIRVEASDQDMSGALVPTDLLGEDATRIEDEWELHDPVMDDDDVRDCLYNLDDTVAGTRSRFMRADPGRHSSGGVLLLDKVRAERAEIEALLDRSFAATVVSVLADPDGWTPPTTTEEQA